MNKKILFSFGLCVLFLGIFFLVPGHSFADDHWCDVLAPANDNSSNSCHGVTQNALYGVDKGNDGYKSEIIAKLSAFYSYGGYQKVGARYFMCGIEGKGPNCDPGTDWKDRINNPLVSLKVVIPDKEVAGTGQGSSGGYYTCINTAYDPDSNSVQSYNDDCGHFDALEFIVNGNVVAAIKRDCGNPLGQINELPSMPKGNFTSLSCSWNGSAYIYTIKANWSNADANPPGSANAQIWGAGGAQHGDTDYASPGTWKISSNDLTPGTWPIQLAVQVVGSGGGYATVDTSNAPPCGHFTSVSCSGNNYVLIASWQDADANPPSSNNAYITGTGGGNQQGTRYSSPNNGNNGNPSPWTVSTSTFTSGTWPVKLWVQNVADNSQGDVTGPDWQVADTANQPNCGPSGNITSITYSCSTQMYTVRATWNDPDASSSNPANAYITGQGGGNQQATKYSSPGTWNVSSSTFTSATSPIKLWVQDVGNGGTYVIRDSYALPPATDAACSHTGCPGDATIAANPNVTVALPNLMPSDSTHGTSAPSGATTTPNQVYYTESETSTVLRALFDNSSRSIGGSANSINIVSPDRIGGTTSTINQTKVNYQPFITGSTAHLYDNNQAGVTYATNYKETKYQTSGSVSYYQCDHGGTLSGAKCKFIHNKDASGNCPAGYRSISSTQCEYDGNATAYYTWRQVSGPTNITSSDSTTYGYKMNACYPRNFSVNSVSPSATLQSNSEDPTTGSATATTSIHFYVSQGGALRKPYAVNGLAYTARMQGQNSLVCSSTGNGTFNVTTGSTASDYTDSSENIPYNATCNVVQEPPVGGYVSAYYDVNPGGCTMDQNGTIVNGSCADVSNTAISQPVQNEPYVKVYGGDVAAGIGFTNGASCDSSASAQIRTYNAGANQYGGSSTDLAALSPGRINSFATAWASSGSVSPPEGLSIANTVAANNPYGGGYGTAPTCSTDYYDDGAGGGQPLGSGGVNLSSLADGSYSASTITNLSGSLGNSSDNGKHVVIYASGDVYIGSNINLATGATIPANIPSFTLVIKGGNLYIGNNVTALSGNYIVQPNGSNTGSIYTCASGIGSPMADASEYAQCAKKLTVSGSFLANTIHFNRLGDMGSLRYSGADTQSSNNASEEFDYTPFSWLAQPPPSNQPPKYDSVVSLPPVL